MFTIPVDDFMQSLEHIGWFVKKRNTRKEMAFWNHVCYYFSFNSLEFPFWSCWFLISLPLPNPLCSSQLCCFLLSCTLFCLPIWWRTAPPLLLQFQKKIARLRIWEFSSTVWLQMELGGQQPGPWAMLWAEHCYAADEGKQTIFGSDKNGQIIRRNPAS